MSAIIDDKTEHCIPFILKAYEEHQTHRFQNKGAPLFVGLNGVQGCGKTTLVSTLAQKLREEHNLNTLVLSLDDLYLTHEKQQELAKANPENPLVQHRGEPGKQPCPSPLATSRTSSRHNSLHKHISYPSLDPSETPTDRPETGTHDLFLATNVFEHLRKNEVFRAPSYDKSAFSGAGDRRPYLQGEKLNTSGHLIKVIILEGWMVGFKALTDEEVKAKWEEAKKDERSTLGKNKLEDLLFINNKLREYECLWEQLEYIIHLDASSLSYVYAWRLEAERALRAEKGDSNAMSDAQIEKFVDGYFPAYELYTDGLREVQWGGVDWRKLRMVIDKERKVKSVESCDKPAVETPDPRLALGGYFSAV